MLLHSDLTKKAVVSYRTAEWRPSPLPGVNRLMLERIGNEKVSRATSIVTYQPGSSFSEHFHDGGEEFLVLDGVFSDTTGDFGAGSYVRNPVGSRHAPWSDPGTTIFVKLAQFDPADQKIVRLDTENATWTEGPVESVKILPLHRFGTETVRLIRLVPSTSLLELDDAGGIEIFVIQGSVRMARGGSLEERDWLRLPPGRSVAFSSDSGATLYVKTGHLVAQPPLTSGDDHD